MNDDLDTKPDAELNELFAVEIAGFSGVMGTIAFTRQPGSLVAELKQDAVFCTDANAVLPWLEKQGWKGCSNRCGSTSAATVFVVCPQHPSQEISAVSYDHPNDFCRAAVIALLRAKRASP